MCSERSHRPHFSGSEFKQRSYWSQRFHFNSREIKQCNLCSQRFHFNSSEAKYGSEHSQCNVVL